MEAALAVVQLVELGWSHLEKRQKNMLSNALHEQELSFVTAELMEERRETKRLQSLLSEYHSILDVIVKEAEEHKWLLENKQQKQGKEVGEAEKAESLKQQGKYRHVGGESVLLDSQFYYDTYGECDGARHGNKTEGAKAAEDVGLRGVEWLCERGATDEGTAEILELLKKKVNSLDFLARMRGLPSVAEEDAIAAAAMDIAVRTSGGCTEVNLLAPASAAGSAAVLKGEEEEGPEDCWWFLVPGADPWTLKLEEEPSGLDGENYGIIDQEEIISIMADIVARALRIHPSSADMTPEELQTAITEALSDLRAKSVLKNLWQWGRFIHESSGCMRAVFRHFRTQARLKATAVAIWTSACFMLGRTLR
eukprot:TRINITY_DN3880_c0_g1_i1.p1 TRINITY_DN3880_c0_g1~~TRINITY_DN3880_c0_g1_i1.p1  ORF type:complete len:366 (-),score=129.33 TRINITY_DN3880_c0_g1_i1:213-1310(-)